MVWKNAVNFIDLSVPLNENTPVFPGDQPVRLEPGGIFEKDGYEDHYLRIGTHIGTHIDAPSHMVKDGKNLDQISLDHFFGPGVYVRVEKEFGLDVVKEIPMKQGDIALFHTEMIDRYSEPGYFTENPEMSEELANYLIEKRVKMVGLDSCSVDRDPYPIHRILLKHDILLIENLRNLELLEGKKFNVYALPLNLQVDGSPARIVAEILG